MIRYFAACDTPWDYVGRIFRAGREMAMMGIEPA